MGGCFCIQQEFRCPVCRNKYFGCGDTKEEAFNRVELYGGKKYRYACDKDWGIEYYNPPGSLLASGWKRCLGSSPIDERPPVYLSCKCGFASNKYDDFVS